MDADSVNEVIDDVYDIGEDLIEDEVLTKVLMAVLGTTTGFWAILLTPIAKQLLVYPCRLLRAAKRSGQIRIDKVEGELIIRKVENAVEEGNEQDYVDTISGY